MSVTIPTEALRRFLLRGWLTHDAMWLRAALQEVGTARAMVLNRRAVEAMAQVEARRLLEVLGLRGVTDLGELERFMTGAMELLGGDFMQYTWQWRPPDRLTVQVVRCFAHRGVGRLGVLDAYRCGPFDRIYGWLIALDIPFRVTPADDRCMMHHLGRCERELRFDFTKQEVKDAAR